MQARVRVFTYSGRIGTMPIESELEDHINDWLNQSSGRMLFVTQSESQTAGQSHTTVTVWYEPAT
jgi:hypothetical protein